MLDSYWALIIPSATGSFGIFLFRQFFRTLPAELEDAARIDGASELSILWQVVIPISGPAVATVAILHFQGVWNSFLWPYLVTNNGDLYTLQVGLLFLTSNYNPRPYIQMAGTFIATVPIVVLFFVGQKWFVRGIQLTGFK
jgi:multiple sugar transport system permease protein